jgi:hypothetical protein
MAMTKASLMKQAYFKSLLRSCLLAFHEPKSLSWPRTKARTQNTVNHENIAKGVGFEYYGREENNYDQQLNPFQGLKINCLFYSAKQVCTREVSGKTRKRPQK